MKWQACSFFKNETLLKKETLLKRVSEFCGIFSDTCFKEHLLGECLCLLELHLTLILFNF